MHTLNKSNTQQLKRGLDLIDSFSIFGNPKEMRSDWDLHLQ